MSERGGYVPPEAAQKKPEDDFSNDGSATFGQDTIKRRNRGYDIPYGSDSLERPSSNPEVMPQQLRQGDSSNQQSQQDDATSGSQQSQQDDATGGSAQSDPTANPQAQQQDQIQQAPGDSRADLSHLSTEDRAKYDEALANIRRLAGEQALNHTLRPGE